VPAPVGFPDFVASLSDLGRMAREDAAMQARIESVVDQLRAELEITPASLATFVQRNPDSVPILATCVGLTHEQLKNQLLHRAGTAGWVTLARREPERLVSVLDEGFDLVRLLGEQLAREWSFGDVLLERYLWSRRGAASAVGQGRSVEDEVEAVVRGLEIDFQARTRFLGRGGSTGPADLAIPAGGDRAQIVVGMKGFNSTGSKLTDAVREVEQMADVRLPTQYVYAVVDGIGWKSRQADLRRIYDLWERRSIDGLYALAHLDRFRDDLRNAALRLGLAVRDVTE
jgi:hypothetical protein